MPRIRDEKVYFWSFTGTVKEFVEALKILNMSKREVFEPAMHKTIAKANKIKNNPRFITD